MNAPRTTGIEFKTQRRWLAETIEVVSSMRFSISLLTLIAVASTIGTVMKQNEPMNNYINQFGPFWFEVFRKISLYAVYSSWWFLLIMAVLCLSTSLCIARNGPKMIKDMRSWRDNVREQSLRNFHHKNAWTSSLPRGALAQQTVARLGDAGYHAKVVEKDGATLVAAKKGAANKFGYIFAHGAIVVICVGGVLDSDMPIRLQEWFLGKTPFGGDGLIAEIPAQHRLGLGNPTFRGNTEIPEGSSSATAIIPRADGVLIQDLPFTIALKKFTIDFYSTGMPKLFASDVVITDHETGQSFPANIQVNHPLVYKGYALFQSSFGDGGSKLKLTGFPMTGTGSATFAIDGAVNGTTKLTSSQGAGDSYTVEWSGFRPFNVENMASQDARAVTKGQSLEQQFAVGLDKRLGSAGKNANNKDLKNVGPSVEYKLRDKTGQAREFQNYMQPVTVDGVQVYLAGVRASPSDPFSFLRIPADDGHSVKEWMRLRGALQDPALRAKAAKAYAARAMPQADAEALRRQLEESANKSLGIFAGNGQEGGFVAISHFLEKIPAADQEKAADIFMKLLNGSFWDLWQAARAQDGLAPVATDDTHARFLQLATNALSDSFLYGAPVYLQLEDFNEIKSSVLQVTRAPGQKVVYLGCFFLVLGVFSMFYIRERRVWVWIRDDSAGATALMAMSTQRKTLDFEKEFEDLKTKLPQSA